MVRVPAGPHQGSPAPPRGAANECEHGGSSSSMQATVVVFTNDARRDLARLDRDRLIDDALLLCVITHLDVAGGRKVLAERMTDETVVGQDASQIEMAFEQDAVEVEGL